MRGLFGTVLPYVARVTRSDGGKAIRIAWLGLGVDLDYGPEPRSVDTYQTIGADVQRDGLKVGAGAKPPGTFRCGSRDDNALADRSFPGLDHWRAMPDGTRTCSFCGSLHEDDYLAILEGYVANVPGFMFDTTTKSYKRYAHRPGTSNASQGGIKFYGWHADQTPGPALERRLALNNAAMARFRSDLRAMYDAGR